MATAVVPPPTSDTEDASTASDSIDGPSWARRNLGLIIAPFAIAGLGFALYLYYGSLDLANARIMQRSALDWDSKLQPQTIAHLKIAVLSTLIVVVTAIPAGIVLTRPRLRRVAPYVVTVANAGQAFPAYGLLVLFFIWLADFTSGTNVVIIALAFYAFLPVLRNTMVGLDAVDRNVIEAGRGMGMTKSQALLQIEMPLAVPIILAGVRIAMVLNVGMAALAYLLGGGALGVTIGSGLKNDEPPVYFVAGILVAIIALSMDWVGAVAERTFKPRGL